jgi:hypothetical protein
MTGPTRELSEQAKQADLKSVQETADPANVARAIVEVVAMPYGNRPFRVTIDPADGGAAELNKPGDCVRAAYLQNAGLGDLLHPSRQ